MEKFSTNFTDQWFELYDFVEFVANHYHRYRFKEPFTKACNAVLERELSAYRFVNGFITQVTEQQEIEAIEDALEKAEAPVRLHLRRALELLADKSTPDYRNSIKESISAVESLVASKVGESGTLGQLIKKLELRQRSRALSAICMDIRQITVHDKIRG